VSGNHPKTKLFTRSGDLHIAYQVVGDGPRDLVYVAGWLSHIELAWEEPTLAAFLRRLDRKANTGALRYFDLRLSTRAQARLQAAYRQYRPPPFHGRAAILSSAERDAAFRDDGQFWSELLPGRKVYRIADTHGEITGPATCRHAAWRISSLVRVADSPSPLAVAEPSGENPLDRRVKPIA